jgi:uncharacterized damage-inducible protein DinB
MELARHYLDIALETFQKQKALADKALAQLSPEEYFKFIDPESNSIAIIMKHMAGNMRSRWTDFLTTDGEKPDRNRDDEFVESSLETILQSWEASWELVFETIKSLQPGDLLKTVSIRQQPHTVLKAIERQIDHYGYHVGQIVFLAKHLKSKEWKTLSIARRV